MTQHIGDVLKCLEFDKPIRLNFRPATAAGLLERYTLFRPKDIFIIHSGFQFC